MSTTIKALSDGLSGELQINGNPAFRYGADNSGQLFSFRNKIINGDMNIAQRGTSFAATTTYTLDRWGVSPIGATTAVGTASQQADVPSNNEFQYSLRVAVTTADASLAASEGFQIFQQIEGYNARDLIGKTFTLSFWVRSSKTGIHCASFRNSVGDRSYVTEYTINAANTWEYKTVTVTGGLITAGTWDWANGKGLNVAFPLGAGSTYQTTAGAWQTGNYLATANQVNCLDTVGNIFAITGVQLEAGSIATPFEHRPYQVELAMCQRYYEKSFPVGTTPVQNLGVSAGALYATGQSTNVRFGAYAAFKQTKRSPSPNVITYSPNAASANWSTNLTTPTAVVAQSGDSGVYIAGTTAITAGADYGIHWTAEAEL